MSALKRGKEKEARHVRLYHWMMRTPAWRDLDAVARCAYIVLASRYGGEDPHGFSNNGRIPLSLLELSEALGVSKQTAMRALERLQDHGFIVLIKRGAFSVKDRQASEWRLTEFRCDGELPTKDFARWQNPEHGSTSKPERVSGWNRTGVDTEQVTESNRPYGSATTPVAPTHGSTTTPLVVYQGGAASGQSPQARGRRRDRIQTASASAPSPACDPADMRHLPRPVLQKMEVGDA